MKLTIIETGLAPETLRSDWPNYPDMFAKLLAPHAPEMTFETVSVVTGDEFPDPATLDAALITGSVYGVYDEAPWMTPLMDFIRWTGAERIPQIGICFGHQAIAHAFGARVTKSDKGWGIGRHVYDIHAPQNWMGDTPPETFSLGVSHQDQVLSLPPGAELIASSDFCSHAAIAYPGQNAISFQGHPEFSPEFNCALYGVRKGKALPVDMVDAAEASFAEPVENDLVGKWMANFLSAQKLER